jgi:hypothetical protein
LAVTTASAGEGIDAFFEIKVFNQPGLAQALGNLLGLFVFGLKRVDQIQANEVGHFDLNRHGATVGCAGVAHAGFVARPAVCAVDVNNTDGRFH